MATSKCPFFMELKLRSDITGSRVVFYLGGG